MHKLLSTWNIADKEIYFVTDNGRNIVKAINLEPSWTRVPCFAHTLQLVVDDVFPKKTQKTNENPETEETEFGRLRKKCRSIAGYFSHSEDARKQLIHAQKDHDPNCEPLLT